MNALQSFPSLRSTSTAGARTLEFVVGDLVEQSVDVLVAAVGDSDEAISRVQLALRRAAGPALLAEYDARVMSMPGSRLGAFEHVVTRGHRLPAKYVVHVRPLSASAVGDEAEFVLERCFRDAFDECRRLGASSVAAPAIGTGVYGYPISLVARVAVRTAIEAQRRSDGPSRIRFVLASPATREAFVDVAIRERRST